MQISPTAPAPRVPERDLDEILNCATTDMRAFSNARIFVTGGSGFVGSWFLDSVARANEKLQTNISVVVLARDVRKFATQYPQLFTAPRFACVQGDVAALPAALGSFDAIVHAATQPADGPIAAQEPDRVFDVAVNGMRAILAVAKESGNIPMLFTSSGAVYGKQPHDLTTVPEDYPGAPDPSEASNAYGEAKRACEMMCSVSLARKWVKPKIARLFAFVGPRLPHDRQFAAGNFIGDALCRRSVAVKSDGSAVRSYLYPTDMIAWLWAIFSRGVDGRPYNVGSDQSVSIRELAQLIAGSVDPRAAVNIEGVKSSGPRSRYVPNIERARSELGVSVRIPLRDAINRAIDFSRGVQ